MNVFNKKGVIYMVSLFKSLECIGRFSTSVFFKLSINILLMPSAYPSIPTFSKS